MLRSGQHCGKYFGDRRREVAEESALLNGLVFQLTFKSNSDIKHHVWRFRRRYVFDFINMSRDSIIDLSSFSSFAVGDGNLKMLSIAVFFKFTFELLSMKPYR
jgi:hypothetical protein